MKTLCEGDAEFGEHAAYAVDAADSLSGVRSYLDGPEHAVGSVRRESGAAIWKTD